MKILVKVPLHQNVDWLKGLWRDVIMFVSRIPDAKDAITYIVQPQTYEHKLANSILKIIIRPSHHTAWQLLSRVYVCVLLVNRLTHSIPSEVRSNLGCNVCLLILMYDEKINSILCILDLRKLTWMLLLFDSIEIPFSWNFVSCSAT